VDLLFKSGDPILQIADFQCLGVSLDERRDLCRFLRRDLSSGDGGEDGANSLRSVCGGFDQRQSEGDGAIFPGWDDPLQAQTQCDPVAFQGFLDRLAGERLGFAIEKGFRRYRRFMARPFRLSGGIARLAGLKAPALI
jgi:hypothetical protein